jgi:hypothetical protein
VLREIEKRDQQKVTREKERESRESSFFSFTLSALCEL